MLSTRQSSLYRAADAAGFATVWHDEPVATPVRGFDRFFAKLARIFG